jgi:hypothetical protein
LKRQYLFQIEKELDRLWCGHNHVLVIELGCDKFLLSDGKTNLRAKGFELIRVTKRLHDKAGIDKFWRAMNGLKPYPARNKHVVAASSDFVAGRR